MKNRKLVSVAMLMGLMLSMSAGANRYGQPEPEIRENRVGKVAVAVASALVKFQFAPFASFDRLDAKYNWSERLGMVGPGDVCKEHSRGNHPYDDRIEGYECHKEGSPDKVYLASTANFLFSRVMTTSFCLYGTYKWWQLEYLMLASLGLV